MRTHNGLAAVLACLVATGCASPVPPAATLTAPVGTSIRPAAAPVPAGTASPKASRCVERVRRLSLRDQVGQLLMVGVSSAGPGAAAEALRTTRAGSVVLLGNSTAGVARIRRMTGEVRKATRQSAGIAPLLAADQEGGLVQRLQGPGFARIPSAQDQARLTDRTLRIRAAGWGKQLRAAGIDADLAPVADVVPAKLGSRNRPIGALHRGYGSSPKVVARKVTAFSRGMQRAEVITAVKHFPGLGRVRGNTDFVTKVVDTQTRRHDPALAGFAAAVDAGADLVMLSSAYYRRIDPNHQATFSRKVIATMLRGDLHFSGVVISDDLSAAALRDLSPGRRAVRFVRAGGDLAIVGDPRQAPAMARALRQTAADDPHFRAKITAAATRVVALKAAHGLADC